MASAQPTERQKSENDLVTMLRQFEDRFRAALGAQRPWDQWWAIALHHAGTSYTKLPYAKVTKSETVSAYLTAAKLGLLLDGEECHVMIRGKQEAKIKCEVCAAGVVRKAGQAGIRIQARKIKEGDFIELDEGAGKVSHKPAWLVGAEPGKTIGAYAIASYRDGRTVVRALSAAEIEKRAPKTSSAWDEWTDEMAEKTMILHLRKVLYFGDEVEELLSTPSAAIGDTWGMSQEAPNGTPDAPVHPPQSVRDKVAAAAARKAQDDVAEAGQDEPAGDRWEGSDASPI